MEHTFASSEEFFYKEKRISISRDMVIKVLGIPSGSKEVETRSSDFEIEALVEKYKLEYKEGHTYPIKKCMKLMDKEEDEQKFMRHFMLFLISSLLIPGKANTCSVQYLYSLIDLEMLSKYDLEDCILYVVMSEVRRYHTLRDFLGRSVAKKHFYMEGCLPLLAIICVDFLDLPRGSAHVHRINYSLPRICNMSSADFEFVMEIDRDNDGPRHHYYGVRPFRDISHTPYCTTEPPRPESSQLLYHRDVDRLVIKLRLLWKDDLSFVVRTFNEVHEKHIMSFVSDLNNLYVTKIAELSSYNGRSGARSDRVGVQVTPAVISAHESTPVTANVVGTRIQDLGTSFPAQEDAGVLNGVSVETDRANVGFSAPLNDSALDASPLATSGVGNPVETDMANVGFSVPLNDSALDAPPLATSGVGNPVEYQLPVISNVGISDETLIPNDLSWALEIPSKTNVEGSSLLASFSECDNVEVEAGIGIAMSYASNTPIASIANVNVGESISLGPSTIDLKNRKKRKATNVNDDLRLVVKVSDEVESFYTRYLRTRALKRADVKKNPVFVSLRDFHLTYDEFCDSLRARSTISDRVMAVYLHVFNGQPEKYIFDQSQRKKIDFSPFFTKKLLVNPSLFQTRCCIGELRKANDILFINSADLIYFPVIIQEHWVLMCINVLYKTLNFFDSANLTSDVDAERMLRNLASNFTKVCLEAEISSEGYDCFGSSSPTNYPQQETIYDCGLYCIIYMDCWDGLIMRQFIQEDVLEYRKIIAHKIYHSPRNESCGDIPEVVPSKGTKRLKKK